MPGLIDKCKELFGSLSLYEVLGIDSSASNGEVKRGYHKLSLKVHPDRAQEDDKQEATEKFQTLGKVYAILSDKDKRAIYDESGEVEEENDVTADRDWNDYWRLLFAKVSVGDIKEFEKKYKGSDEEFSDLKSAYMDYEGDMDMILDNILCATIDDEERFEKILRDLIKKKEITDFKTFTKENSKKKASRKKKAAQEAEEAEEYARELGVNQGDSLQALILKRQQDRAGMADDFLAELEAKYAQPSKKKGKGKKENGVSPSKKKKT